MRRVPYALIIVACAPLVCGATEPAASDPDAGIGRACRYELTGAYTGRLVCYSEQQYDRNGSHKPGVHLDEDPASVARVQVDFVLEEPPHYGIQAPSSVSGTASMRVANLGRWIATTHPDPRAKKLGTFAVTVTDMSRREWNGKHDVEIHGTVDARLVSASTSGPSAGDVDLHATF